MAITAGPQDFLVAGYLSSEDDIRFGDGDHSYIKITLISEIPYSIEKNESPYDNKINFYVWNLQPMFTDDEKEDEITRRENIWNFLHNQIIIVRPTVDMEDGRIYYKGKFPELIKMNLDFDPLETNMVMVPKFSVNNTISSIRNKEDFEINLMEGKSIGKLTQPWPRESVDSPDAIIWEENGDLTVYGGIIDQCYSSASEIAFTAENGELKKILIRPENDRWYANQYTCEDLIFVEKIALNSELDKAKVMNNMPSLAELSDNSEKLILDKEKNKNLNENDLVSRLINVVAREKLYYKDVDLINFHTAMKSDGLVVLSGLSGTGKSQLALSYAKALQIPNENIGFIPVRPYWADDSDLIGFADTINSVYRPGDSGLVDLLIDAEKNPDQLYMVVFDEMNLARVEHYFSQFLSVLEMKSNSRKIKLYSKELEARMYNHEKYPASVSVKSNILFVGTVNTDESTYQFSDKVLDRSNVINLEMVPFFETSSAINTDNLIDTQSKNVTEIMVSKSIFDKFKNCSEANALTVDEKRMLWEIQQNLSDVDKNIGIGWRIVNQINDYLCNLPQNNALKKATALDMQLNQRVWTKIRGSEDQLKELLGSITSDGKFVKGRLESILDDHSNSSDFKISRKVIRRKVKELGVYGFTN